MHVPRLLAWQWRTTGMNLFRVLLDLHVLQDGFYEGELMSGKRGLVPSNFVEKVPGMFFEVTHMCLKGQKKVKSVYSWFTVSQVRDVTCHMSSHSVTCHPTQVIAPRLNVSLNVSQ